VVFLILVFICFWILLSLGSYLLSAIVEPNDPYLIDGVYTASNGGNIIVQPPVQRSDNEMSGIEFTWSVWMQITTLDSVSNLKYKHVFSKGDNNNTELDSLGAFRPNNAPGLYIDTTTTSTDDSYKIVVIMNTFEMITEQIIINNIPLRKWIHVIIRVEGNFLDVYVNGTLAKRIVLSSVPKQNDGSVYICQNGGFSGFLSNLRYYRNALEPGDILNITNGGPSLKTSKLEKQYLKNTDYNFFSMDWYTNNAMRS
jgi:hypothetical protein